MSTETATQKTPSEVSMAERTRNGMCFRPHVDIREQSDELTILADVPSAKATRSTWTLRTARSRFVPGIAAAEPRPPLSAPRIRVGDYCRTFEVSEAIDSTKITAEYADGVSRFTCPRPRPSSRGTRCLPIDPITKEDVR